VTSKVQGEARLRQAAHKQGRPRGTCVGGYLEIDASPSVVWGIIADLANWGDWNPLYTRMAGELREGASLEMTVAVPGMKPMETPATVFTVRPGECFEYGLEKAGGLLRAFRFIEVTRISSDRCGVANGETMSGPVGWLVARLAGAKVGAGLREMNEKLKLLAEERSRSAAA
jgi:hypothetical protein